MYQKGLSLIEEMEQAERPWVWKDPALIFFLPFWTELWDDPVFVLTIRNPYHVAQSWERFARSRELPASVRFIETNLHRWQYMMRLMLEHTEPASSKTFISYDQLLRDLYSIARRLKGYGTENELAMATDVVRTPSALPEAIERTAQPMHRLVH